VELFKGDGFQKELASPFQKREPSYSSLLSPVFSDNTPSQFLNVDSRADLLAHESQDLEAKEELQVTSSAPDVQVVLEAVKGAESTERRPGRH